MKKWVCTVCGYIYEGEEPPEKCPVCGVNSDKFVEKKDKLDWADEHHVGCAKGIDEDLLEDVLIENKQAMEMSKIYSDILSGVMDAYSSIISNNLNGVMKILTAITIIISVPTMISSFWGMNVKVPMQDNPWGFAIILIASILIGIIVTIILKRKDYLN